MTIDQLDYCMPDVTTPTMNSIPMLGQSPTPYQSIGIGMLKDSSLMGVFPSTPLSTEVVTVNMISTTGFSTKGKEIVESSSIGPHEAMYDAIQSISNDHVDDLHHGFGYVPPALLDGTLSSHSRLSHTEFSFR